MDVALLGDVHWLAIVVATLVSFVLGGIWYLPPVFGNRWSQAMGWDADEQESPGPALYLVPLAGCLVATVAVSLLAAAIEVAGAATGLVLGLVVGVGIAAAVLFVTGIFDPHKRSPLVWFVITAGYYVVGLAAAGAIIGAWA